MKPHLSRTDEFSNPLLVCEKSKFGKKNERGRVKFFDNKRERVYFIRERSERWLNCLTRFTRTLQRNFIKVSIISLLILCYYSYISSQNSIVVQS